ncbi:MAG: hypothetical protein MZV63_36245 [Marinilabiliales bacterium]|nr:hypothetical protein [Marinilabiliales bacterium]
MRVNSLGAKLRGFRTVALAPDHRQMAWGPRDVPGFRAGVREPGFRTRPRHSPQEPGRIRDWTIALPDRWRPVGRCVEAGVARVRARNGVRTEFRPQQRRHRQPGTSVFAVRTDHARLLRVPARVLDWS